MSALKNKVILFGIIIVLVLYIIFLHCTTRTGISPDARLIITTSVWAENVTIGRYLDVLEMLDKNNIDAAKKSIQNLLYISIMVPPDWELMGPLNGLDLETQRIELLKRIKKYHEEHKNEIDMKFPSNQKAVQQLDSLEQQDGV
jgi:hypothetical protein